MGFHTSSAMFKTRVWWPSVQLALPPSTSAGHAMVIIPHLLSHPQRQCLRQASYSVVPVTNLATILHGREMPCGNQQPLLQPVDSLSSADGTHKKCDCTADPKHAEEWADWRSWFLTLVSRRQ